ncbi:MAG: ACT domain-containing protein [Anaerolineae bacterium]|nr:ACT domain-containing protein [Anaerolineae bacterium]
MTTNLSLLVLPGRLAVCRLAPDAPLPMPATCTCLWSATRTGEELSVVLPEDMAPSNCQAEMGWRCFKVVGPLDFGLTGILASLATSLAGAGIPIFAISTYDTDYILVKEENLVRAAQALRGEGHTVIDMPR